MRQIMHLTQYRYPVPAVDAEWAMVSNIFENLKDRASLFTKLLLRDPRWITIQTVAPSWAVDLRVLFAAEFIGPRVYISRVVLINSVWGWLLGRIKCNKKNKSEK